MPINHRNNFLLQYAVLTRKADQYGILIYILSECNFNKPYALNTRHKRLNKEIPFKQYEVLAEFQIPVFWPDLN